MAGHHGSSGKARPRLGDSDYPKRGEALQLPLLFPFPTSDRLISIDTFDRIRDPSESLTDEKEHSGNNWSDRNKSWHFDDRFRFEMKAHQIFRQQIFRIRGTSYARTNGQVPFFSTWHPSFRQW